MRMFRVSYVRGFNCFQSEGDIVEENAMIFYRYMKEGMELDEINSKCIWYRFSEIN